MLFEPFHHRALLLSNRIVMAPMARCRVVENNLPNPLMAEYYAQRASAGLTITEGTSPSPNGLGYARMPALFDDAHVRAWRRVTDMVRAKGGKIIVQLMHAGRVAHVANFPPHAEVIGPMAETCPGEMYTDTLGMQPHSPARAMTETDIASVVAEYTRASMLAVEAGFDGVEIHAANGYLIEQFLNPNVNQRTDGYGASIAGRNRLALEVVRAAAKAIGAWRVGIRLSPYGALNGMTPYHDVDNQYVDLVRELSPLKLMYLHVLDHSALGAPPVPDQLKQNLRREFDGPFILAGGFDAAKARQILAENRADLIAFGRPFLANPDLVQRMVIGASLNMPDPNTFYTPGPEGYTDYPLLTMENLNTKLQELHVLDT